MEVSIIELTPFCVQEHVSNKSAYLCGVMKTYRQKSRAGVINTNGAPLQGKVGVHFFRGNFI